MLVGYARVSTTEQSLEVQLDQLAKAGVEKVFSEQRSGKRAANRPELQRALDFCREGDTFVVTRLDRFARSAADLHRTVEQLTAKGVGFRCLQQGGIDTVTTHGKLMLSILAAVAEFELDIRQDRQRERYEGKQGMNSFTPERVNPDRDPHHQNECRQ